VAFFLFLVLVAVILGVIGVAVESLAHLLGIGILVLVAAIAFLAVHLSRRSRQRPTR